MSLLSVKEVSEKLDVSDQYVRSLIRDKEIEATRVGRTWVVSEPAVREYLENRAPADHSRAGEQLPRIKALSFFSGAMGLDLGLEKAGLPILLACEIDKACRQTIQKNRPDLALLGNVCDYSPDEIRSAAGLQDGDEIDVIVGGPPCQAFSTAGARRGFEDERGNVFLRFIELILALKPRYAVIENVRGLISAPMSHRPHAERSDEWIPEEAERPGGALLHILSLLRIGGYSVSFNLYNAANFGVPQSRERVVLICHRGGEKLPHLMPTHAQEGASGLPKWRTLREALAGLEHAEHHHVSFPEDRLRFYRLLGPGQYWKHLPEELQRQALGKSYFAGGGKTGFLRRLAWDKPSCTLVTAPNMPATDICHPTEHRPLSIEEYKRIQQFPDDWEVCGSLKDQYRQIGNAVPVGLGEAVGHAILRHMAGKTVQPPSDFQYSRYKATDEVSWEKQTLAALAAPAQIQRKRAVRQADENQLGLDL